MNLYRVTWESFRLHISSCCHYGGGNSAVVGATYLVGHRFLCFSADINLGLRQHYVSNPPPDQTISPCFRSSHQRVFFEHWRQSTSIIRRTCFKRRPGCSMRLGRVAAPLYRQRQCVVHLLSFLPPFGRLPPLFLQLQHRLFKELKEPKNNEQFFFFGITRATLKLSPSSSQNCL